MGCGGGGGGGDGVGVVVLKGVVELPPNVSRGGGSASILLVVGEIVGDDGGESDWMDRVGANEGIMSVRSLIKSPIVDGIKVDGGDFYSD